MNLKKAITDRGFTLQQIADKLGISNQAVSQAVNGNPSLSRLEEIADAMQITVSQLLADEQETASLVCPHCGGKIHVKFSEGC